MNYRLDLDGLRAVAVSLVILFHFEIAGFTGGFVGVDVFFTISGYLIGSLVVGQLDQQRFSFINFYMRRFRRLFPVYFVVILVTSIFSYWLLLPVDFKDFGQSVIASVLYVSNILFFMESGYFDSASHLKPLLHTWSLSVEEQFYMFFPFIAWLCFRIKRSSLVPVFCFLTLASFIGMLFCVSYDISAAFYLYPFRAWELFIGVLLAMGVFPAVRSATMANILSVLGAAMIAAASYFYTKATVFPGVTALLPCVGTLLLIHAGSKQFDRVPVLTLLSTSPAVFLGKISYSLYLWHWPVFVLYTYVTPEPLTALETLLLLFVTVILSVLSWHFVETPIREARRPIYKKQPAIFGGVAVASLLCVLFGFQIHRSNGMPDRLDPQTARLAAVAEDFIGWGDNCYGQDNPYIEGVQHCSAGNPYDGDNYILVWGDSHAAAVQKGLTSLFDEHGENALILWEGGCPPVLDILKEENGYGEADTARCAAQTHYAREVMARDADKIKAVLLIGRWSYYTQGVGYGVDEQNHIKIWPQAGEYSAQGQAGALIDGLLATRNYLSELELPLFFMEQFPEFAQYNSRRLAVSLMSGRGDYENMLASDVLQDYTQVQERQSVIQQAVRQWLADEEPLFLIETHRYFCDQRACSMMLSERPAYFDNNHVTTTTSVELNSLFMPIIDYSQTSN